jgi:hypothetical protein
MNVLRRVGDGMMVCRVANATKDPEDVVNQAINGLATII